MILRLGEFAVYKEQGNGVDWISVKATSGFWTVRYREDNPMYHLLSAFMSDGDMKGYLEAYFKMNYTLSNTLPDLTFMGEYLKLYNEFLERRREQEPSISEKEDEAILAAECSFYNSEKKLEAYGREASEGTEAGAWKGDY